MEQEEGNLSLGSDRYPKNLAAIPDPPDPLHFRGRYHGNLFDRVLAVVGSRAVTMYGEWVVKNIVKEVAGCGITIVSGFMYGVDALSHQAALDVGGMTIAVMAGGVNLVFPKYQEGLYWDIVKTGLVVSEYKEQIAEGRWTFARRNRIVAGLAHAVLVVEAAESSGSLITAKYAKQYGRRLLTVPGNLNSANSYGTTQLLKDGAELVACADDVLRVFFGDSDNYRSRVSSAVNKRLLSEDLETLPQNIVDLLYLESLSADEIAIKLTLSVGNIFKALTALSVIGTVCEKEGRYYIN